MEDVRKQKDDQFRGIIAQMEETVTGWNSQSCPIIRYIDIANNAVHINAIFPENFLKDKARRC